MPSPPYHGSGQSEGERIFANELCAHRFTLQQQLQAWSCEQDQILERAFATLTHGRIPWKALEVNQCAEGGCSNGNEKHDAAFGNSSRSPDEIYPAADEIDPVGSLADHPDGSLADELAALKEHNRSSHTLNGNGHDSQHPEISRQASLLPGAEPTQMSELDAAGRTSSTTFSSSLVRSNAQEFDREQIVSQATALGFKRKRTTGIFNKNGLMGSCASSIVYSKRFETTCAIVILLNAVLLGVSSDYAMAHLDNPDHPALSAIELGFCVFYTVEVILRMYVLRCTYFNSKDWKWNWFDLGLVLMSVWDQIEARLDLLGGKSAMKNLSFLRMLRLMKMLKLLRMVRLMRMFRELRLILHSVLGCVQAMFWAMVLILTISYMFGICFLQACTSYLQAADQDRIHPDDADGIAEYWSSVGSAMLSLYMAATAGKEWGTISQPLRTVGLPFYMLFLVYIAFFAFVVMNTVTGLFLEATLAHSDKDQQMVIQMELERKGQYIDKLQAFYDEMDDDQDGQITYEEFCRHVNTPEMRAFAGSLEIDVLDAKQFFCILSDHGRRCVDVETFVVGCIKLKGAARSMDLMDLVYAHREAHSEARFHAESTTDRLERLEKLLKQALPQAGRKFGFSRPSFLSGWAAPGSRGSVSGP